MWLCSSVIFHLILFISNVKTWGNASPSSPSFCLRSAVIHLAGLHVSARTQWHFHTFLYSGRLFLGHSTKVNVTDSIFLHHRYMTSFCVWILTVAVMKFAAVCTWLYRYCWTANIPSVIVQDGQKEYCCKVQNLTNVTDISFWCGKHTKDLVSE